MSATKAKQKDGIRPIKLKNGERRYEARYRDTSGRRRSKLFRRRTDALTFLSEVRVKKAKGEFLDPALSRMRFSEFADGWLKSKHDVKPKTRAGYESLLASRILPTFGRTPLNGIRRDDVVRWVASMKADGLSPSRIRQAHQCLGAVLDSAVDNDYIPKNVARRVPLPSLTTKPRQFLSAEEVARLAAEVGPEYRALVLVLAYGGLRFGEAVALRRSACNLLRSRLDVAESATTINGAVVFGETKTDRRRTVMLPTFAVEELARHLESVPADPDALVFTAPRGGVLHYNNFRRNVWDPARDRAGLPNLTPHELRHTCASLLRELGADAKEIQTQLGHSSIQVTMNVYTHLFPGALDDVMAKADAQHRAVS